MAEQGARTGAPGDAGDGERGMASVAKGGVAGGYGPAEERKLALLVLRIQLILAALMTLSIGCFAIPAQLAAQRYDSAPRCPGTTQGPNCVASVPVTVSSIDQGGDERDTSYWLELTGIGSGQTTFTPAGSNHGLHGLIAQVKPGQQVTATVWHGDLIQLESAGTVSVDSGSPDIRARNWLGGFAIPCSFLLGFVIMYVGRRRPGRRAKALGMGVGLLVILNGPAFLFLQYALTDRPSPLLALATLAGVGAIAAGLWALNAWGTRRNNRRLVEMLEMRDAVPADSRL
ncbi:hypothetical protein KDL01_01235 [Actinospica durhamensis]|uniref:Uncharacterized protein n=1 Tax=Actinospica durhamensis TaxID=1508375 RepID=A0A941EJW1_9ACTN|nr:hypothetical protein [Actinospica durhamensis]MBR7831862.1 hypothetical protein [Actinospica durhamensis]